MRNEDFGYNRKLTWFVLASLVFFTLATVLRLGLDRTAYETLDSAGRTMGFNDPHSLEHLAIAFGNFQPADFFKEERVYEWLLLGMHAIGALLLLFGEHYSARAVRWFFALQAVLFPFGLLLIWLLPLYVTSILSGSSDREGFIDLPFFMSTAQPMWLLVSAVIVLAMRGPGLGLSHVGKWLAAFPSSGVRVITRALR